jgi:beta-glucanase (GH16 family)
MNQFKINKRAFKYFALSVSVFTFFSCYNDYNQTVTILSQLVIEDEFNVDGAPDSSLWNYEIGKGPGDDGWGNQELQYYTDRPENIIVEDGMLKITAIKESYEGSAYTSSRITTKGKYEQKYGRFEARMKLPWGQGLWPAFWMLGSNIDEVSWPNCGEIDIMENRGQEPTLVSGALHGPGYSGGNFIGKNYDLVSERVDTSFHIYGIEWGEGYVNFYVDDVLYNQITPADVTGDWIFDQPFYIIMNVAVGGGFVGSPNADTVFPQTMLVDYVRIYQ